jgi:hypothetical protein
MRIPNRMFPYFDSFHRVNTLYDGTVNCFSTIALSSEALNETFTYKQALQQPDYHDFIEAVVTEVDNHKTRKYWALMLRRDMPADTKTVMSIWSFKQNLRGFSSYLPCGPSDGLSIVCPSPRYQNFRPEGIGLF